MPISFRVQQMHSGVWKKKFPGARIRAALTGSGAKTISEVLKLPFVQGSGGKFHCPAAQVSPG